MTAVPMLRWWHFRGAATLTVAEENRQVPPNDPPQFQTYVTAKAGGEVHRFSVRGLLRNQRDGLDDCYVYTAARPSVGEWVEVEDPGAPEPVERCDHGCNAIYADCPVHDPKGDSRG